MTKLTKEQWMERKSSKAIYVHVKPSPNPHGVKIACLMGCGNHVAKSVGICRDCRRTGKRKIERVKYQARKAARKK